MATGDRVDRTVLGETDRRIQVVGGGVLLRPIQGGTAWNSIKIGMRFDTLQNNSVETIQIGLSNAAQTNHLSAHRWGTITSYDGYASSQVNQIKIAGGAFSAGTASADQPWMAKTGKAHSALILVITKAASYSMSIYWRIGTTSTTDYTSLDVTPSIFYDNMQSLAAPTSPFALAASYSGITMPANDLEYLRIFCSGANATEISDAYVKVLA